MHAEDQVDGNVPEDRGQSTDNIDNGVYGDTITELQEDQYFKLGFLNVNGLQAEKWKEKNTEIFRTIKKYQFDVMGLSEVNIYWPKINHTNRWEDRVAIGKWNNTRSSISYNKHDSATLAFQPGGCIQLITDRASARFISDGKDSSGLGRWTWTRYQ